MAPRKTKKTHRKPTKVETIPPQREDVESEEELLEEVEEIPEDVESDEEVEEIPEDVESDEEILSEVSGEGASDDESDEEAPPPTKTKRSLKKAASDEPKPKKAPTRRQKKNSSDDEAEEPGKRYFKILVESISAQGESPNVPIGDDKKELSSNGGRYTGKNPMQAAKKAFTRICRAAADGGECEYIFSMQETTQTSAKKVFTYRGKREELDEPQQIVKGGGEPYNIRFMSKVWSYKDDSKAPAKKAPAKKAPAKRAPAKKAPTKKAPTTQETDTPVQKAPVKRGRKKKS